MQLNKEISQSVLCCFLLLMWAVSVKFSKLFFLIMLPPTKKKIHQFNFFWLLSTVLLYFLFCLKLSCFLHNLSQVLQTVEPHYPASIADQQGFSFLLIPYLVSKMHLLLFLCMCLQDTKSSFLMSCHNILLINFCQVVGNKTLSPAPHWCLVI